MNPQQALEKQIEVYRAMTREEQVGIGLRLHEMACDIARLGIRRQHLSASAEEGEVLLRQRLESEPGVLQAPNRGNASKSPVCMH